MTRESHTVARWRRIASRDGDAVGQPMMSFCSSECINGREMAENRGAGSMASYLEDELISRGERERERRYPVSKRSLAMLRAGQGAIAISAKEGLGGQAYRDKISHRIGIALSGVRYAMSRYAVRRCRR